MSGKTCQLHLLTADSPAQALPLSAALSGFFDQGNTNQSSGPELAMCAFRTQILLSFSSSTVNNKSLFQLAQGLITINFGRREWRPCNFSTNYKTVSQEKICSHFHLEHTYKLCIILQVFLT